MDVEQAIRAVVAGDREAYAVVVDRWEGLIRAWLTVRCPPQVEAEELAHRVFITAYEHLVDYRPGTDVRSWLLTIARNKLLAECKQLRTRERHRTHVAQDLLLRYAQQEAAQDVDQEERTREGVALHACLQGLAPTARELVRQRYVDDCPLAEIATATGRSLGAIKKALFQVRARLADCVRLRLAAEEH